MQWHSDATATDRELECSALAGQVLKEVQCRSDRFGFYGVRGTVVNGDLVTEVSLFSTGIQHSLCPLVRGIVESHIPIHDRSRPPAEALERYVGWR